MKNRISVYISGPIHSSGIVSENVLKAMRLAVRLIKMGYAPFCPHLGVQLDPAGFFSREEWLEVDLAWVRKCDALVRFPGESLGADMEVQCASALGIPVFTGEQCLDYLDYYFKYPRD